MKKCIFCEISSSDPKEQVIKRISKTDLLQICDVVVFEPLDPCVDGHLLFVPDLHIDNIGDAKFYSGDVVASVFKAVNLYLQENPMQCNIITNNGADADQTVFHIHVHLVPRTKDDKVTLPWAWQKKQMSK